MIKEEKNKTWNDYLEEGKTLNDLTKEELKQLKETESIHFLLRDPNIFEVINNEFNRFIVGEESTRKAIFICGCGVFVKNISATFNVLISGESSVGKSWITKNVLNIFPKSIFSKATYRTRISPNVLTYWHNSKVEPDWTWNGKILYLEDVGNNILNCDVFKVMVSEGSIATIVGRSKLKDVEMPVAIDIEIMGKPITFITTATGVPIDEIKNRFLLIDLDESAEQTNKIMKRQMENAISGKKEEYPEEIKIALSQLERVEVVLPKWIKNIVDYMPKKEIVRWRREFPRFLEIIKCSASLHQFQRERDTLNRIIANEQDYEIAREVIGKISVSSGIEGLTHREKIAYEKVNQYYEEKGNGCSKAEIHSFYPFYSDRGWEKMIDRLAAKGLLTIKIQTNPDTNRKVNYHFPIEMQVISLPPITELIELIQNIRIPILRDTFFEKDNLHWKSRLDKKDSVYVKYDGISSISSPSNERKICPSCDLNVYLEDWNSIKETCRLCNQLTE